MNATRRALAWLPFLGARDSSADETVRPSEETPRDATPDADAEPPAVHRPVTRAEVKRLYARPPSFTDLLPWMEYLPESKCILLEDGMSVGALFELTPVGVEARTPEYLETVYSGLRSALDDALPEDDAAPWVVQVYVQDEAHLHRYLGRIADYVDPPARESDFTREYLGIFAQRLEKVHSSL